MTTYVVPVLALLWGTLDHETISGQQLVAIAGVLAMVAIVQTGSKRTPEVTEAPLSTADAVLFPLVLESEQLVTLPANGRSKSTRRVVQAESQVA